MIHNRYITALLIGSSICSLCIPAAGSYPHHPPEDQIILPAPGSIRSMPDSGNIPTEALADEEMQLLEEKLAKAQKENDRSAIAESYLGLAAFHSSREEHAEAVKLLHNALGYAEKAKSDTLQVSILTQLSRDKRFLSEFDSSIFFSIKALNIQGENGSGIQASNNYFEIGVAYDLKGELDAAMNYLLLALENAEKSENYAQIALVLNSLGIVNRSAGNIEKALDCFKRARELYESLADKRNLGNVLHNIGELYLSQQNYGEGLKYTLEGKTIREEIADYYGLAYSYQNLAFVNFYHLKNYEQAFISDSLAYEIRKKIRDQSGMATSMNDMAWDLLKMGKPVAAKKRSQEALNLARQIGSRTVEKNCYELLSEISVTQNRFEEALQYQLRFSALKDSLFNDEKNKVIQELQVKYETAQKEKQLQENLLIIEKRTLQRNWLFAMAVLAALLAVSVFLGFRNRLRYNQQMNLQAKEIQLRRIRDLEQNQKIIALDAMMKGQEEERQRIANDLHDGLGGLLSSIKHHFRAMSEKNRNLDSVPVYQKTNAMLDEAHEEVRRIAHNMMPDALLKLGLEASIEDLAENYSSENSFQVSVQNLGWSKQPDVSQAIMLYRIVQELLQNVAKHAKATRVFIQFSQFENNLVITVEDNGTGFDKEKMSPNEGMGFKSIESRITYLDGTFETDTSPGNGTISIVRVPLPE